MSQQAMMLLQQFESQSFPLNTSPTNTPLKSELLSPPMLFDDTANFYDPSMSPEGFLASDLSYFTPVSTGIIGPSPSEQLLMQFEEYNQESYEQASITHQRKRSKQSPSEESETNSEVGEDGVGTCVSSAEIKRQIHIQSEQKRRAQIKDGFEELKRHLPNCSNKKISKAAILNKTVQHLEQMKGVQITLMAQLEQIRAENQRLRRFYDMVTQKQPLDKVYSIGL
ncbi:HLH-domain-containing protein [Basidiobolus meristosporus CBS 931.73]|uniref:HLH-domain-containing protein n=1 Tax=Basidiobolus meristosporus CBS 931.73 TaxID=1314790 RepID=A0A1Y1VQV7_9FUNG|nr:HLH-domain-containing protein [Basidiobolus meristosporus CBS 931.73]|eukprot:ORX63659.1 HLH-domain-containing protein [Basidiobolus meristosporus CBS 931.73]